MNPIERSVARSEKAQAANRGLEAMSRPSGAYTAREVQEASDHPELQDHPANVVGIGNATPRMNADLVHKHRAILAREALE